MSLFNMPVEANDIIKRCFPLSSHPTKIARYSGLYCALVAIENVGKATYDIADLILNPTTDPTNASVVHKKRLENLSYHLAGAALFGLCSFNIIPGTSFIAAVGFATYSLSNEVKYFTGTGHAVTIFFRIIGMFFNAFLNAAKGTWRWVVVPLFTHAWDVITFIWNWTVVPFHYHVIIPVLKTIGDIVSKIPLPSNRVWYVFSALAVATIAYSVLKNGF